jgi:hypothetical protein
MGDRLLLVDAANVVGSRPDGWWRDRAGAAARLVTALRAAVADDRLAPPVLVILEGAARAGVPEGEDRGVCVAHAARSGDDALVAAATSSGLPVLLVTADRALCRRARARGAATVGPHHLLDRIGPPPAQG